jgi:AraC family transcriptional regulator of adaptative response/methylated-DNA-[protein]-cysteine methyltransferase
MQPQDKLDYTRIEQAIRFIETHRERQPSLAEMAAAVHLSEFHFNRLFTRWAGTTPQRFTHFLTKEYAKSRLQTASNVAQLAWDAGLSTPSRLHDLFVTFEAMSPGEYRSGGRGLTIRYGFGPTPFGLALLAETTRGICKLAFVSESTQSLAELQAEWPAAALERDDTAAAATLHGIFYPTGKTEKRTPFHLLLRGTNFQIKVWEALLRLAPGELVSYGQLARSIGKAGAERAVGSACGSNSIAWLIPCHRVIQQSGALGGYRWGLERKKVILGWEAAVASRV